MIQNPLILTKEIQDVHIRENFKNLTDYFRGNNQLVGFNFLEINATKAAVNVALNHGLSYIPKDILVSQVTGTGTIQFLYGSFTKTQIFYTTTGPCRVRFFIGSYANDTSIVTAQKTDIQTVAPTPLVASASVISNSSGAYTVLGTESLVLISTTGIGSGYGATVTLPPVASSKGFSFWTEKTDSNFNPVTISTNSRDSLIVPDKANSTTLNVPNERVLLSCDGTNWYVLQRDYPRTWTQFSMSIVAATLPVRGATQSVNKAFWRKNGDSMDIRYEYAQSAGGSAGSGVYYFGLPSLGQTALGIDTGKCTLQGLTPSNPSQSLGSGVAYDGTTYSLLFVIAATSTALSLSTTAANVGSGAFALSNTVLKHGFFATVPISGWKG